MLLFLLGVLDLLAGISLVILRFFPAPTLGLLFGSYVLLKGLIFFRGLVGAMDILAGVFLFLATQGVYNNLTWIFAVWLLQKGFFSLVPQ